MTQAGKLLLQTAQQVLPVLEQAEQTLKAYDEGRQGILRIGVECYPCHEWLTGAIGVFLQAMPDVDIDIDIDIDIVNKVLVFWTGRITESSHRHPGNAR